MSIDITELKKFVFQQPYIQLAVEAMESLQPHFEGHSRLTAQPYGATNAANFQLTLKAQPIAQGAHLDVLVMKFSPQHLNIPNMILPPDLWHRGAMITTLGRITEVAASMNYQVAVIDLVVSQHRRLIKRGANELPKRDQVQLHTGMDFKPFDGAKS